MRKKRLTGTQSSISIFFQHLFQILFWIYTVLRLGVILLSIFATQSIASNPDWGKTIISQRILINLFNWRSILLVLDCGVFGLVLIEWYLKFLHKWIIGISTLIFIVAILWWYMISDVPIFIDKLSHSTTLAIFTFV